MIDPAEMKAFRDALDVFDEAYVNLVQAGRRILILYDTRPAPESRPDKPIVYTGDFCPQCHMAALVKQGGCAICTRCGYRGGCA